MHTTFRHCATWLDFLFFVVLALAVVSLVPLAGCGGPQNGAPPAASAAPAEFTCAMHPQIRQPKPGLCPVCGMQLIPVTAGAGSASDSAWRVTLPPGARIRAAVQTAPVLHKFVPVTLRLTGKVAVDETRVAHLTARVPGRLDKLYVNYTGVDVKSNEHLGLLYSQALYVMQAEYLIARTSGASGAPAGRERLLLAGMTEHQVQELERTATAQLYLTLYAPLTGTVIEKNAVEGMYVDIGTRIFTVADLTALWVVLDAYDSDLPWLRFGQTALFTTDAHPGLVFTGQVGFFAPVLDERTRTVQVRLNVDNAARMLKPGFLVRAEVHATVAGAGRVVEPDLADKWMCPMHPEVIASLATNCSKCGMPLEPLSALGYTAVDIKTAPLVIPATAPLITGTRAIVYIEDPDAKGTFEGREIVLGPRAGDFYLVGRGLRAGERLVVQGNFKIDSTVQLRAQRSMMNPGEPGPPAQPLAAPPVFHTWIVFPGLGREFMPPLDEGSFLFMPTTMAHRRSVKQRIFCTLRTPPSARFPKLRWWPVKSAVPAPRWTPRRFQ